MQYIETPITEENAEKLRSVAARLDIDTSRIASLLLDGLLDLETEDSLYFQFLSSTADENQLALFEDNTFEGNTPSTVENKGEIMPG